jgi:hypothetical protein
MTDTKQNTSELDERGASIVLPEFEAKLAAAANAADQDLIDDITDEYNAARRKEVQAQDKRDERRRNRERSR